MFSLAIPTKKFKEDHTFSESVDLKKTKEKQNKKIYTKVFSQCYLVNRTLAGAPGSFRFSNKIQGFW